MSSAKRIAVALDVHETSAVADPVYCQQGLIFLSAISDLVFETRLHSTGPSDPTNDSFRRENK